MSRQLLRLSTITLLIATVSYLIISKIIFDKIYATSNIIVDEEFHLPLGEAYCQYNFNKWDPKVTTLPGLYLLTSLIFGKWSLCSTYWLRFVSLITSTINVLLFYIFLKLNNKEVPWKNVISAINLSILPPLYFFSHVYYTDVSSIMMTMLVLISAKKEWHYFVSIFGALAIIMRQTNVIWIAMLFGDYILKELYLLSFEKTRYLKQIRIPLESIQTLIRKIVTDPGHILKKTDFQFVLDCSSYLSVIFSFLLFVYLNGSIVVGDKTAHEATIHVPQLFYFATFTLIFAWPHFISCIPQFLKFVWKNKFLFVVLIISSLCIVHYNTLVHPYMLADNRHYVFYVWNRFYGRYNFFRYIMVIIYIFAIYAITSKIWNKYDISFALMLIVCTIIVLVMQKLIEIRYYLFPFILFRLQFKKTHTMILLLENLTYMSINAITLYIFFNKTIMWDTYDYPQRLIW
ncbi:hypothetical protein WA026_008831 [Henosepilachna vigintioctopunctata]|uniref:Dol-P-Glc:Glc(2)Man(9)GlcNAc(2)-PP-Dol alpha-1,2-glucosyltransferase n=1 Tax=Henosepilachna vigintioctopunctata TaxID=420089 RepID=A0AAW1VDH4_9CUCU